MDYICLEDAALDDDADATFRRTDRQTDGSTVQVGFTSAYFLPKQAKLSWEESQKSS